MYNIYRYIYIYIHTYIYIYPGHVFIGSFDGGDASKSPTRVLHVGIDVHSDDGLPPGALGARVRVLDFSAET